MPKSFDITCPHCDATIRVAIVAEGPDERRRTGMPCPECGKGLFSWDSPMVCDVMGVQKRGNRFSEDARG